MCLLPVVYAAKRVCLTCVVLCYCSSGEVGLGESVCVAVAMRRPGLRCRPSCGSGEAMDFVMLDPVQHVFSQQYESREQRQCHLPPMQGPVSLMSV